MGSSPRCILVGSLGGSWAVVPEIYGALAPETLDLYARHPERDAVRAELHGLRPPDAIHLVTTSGDRAARSIDQLSAWWEALGQPFALRIWQAEGTDELSTPAECQRLRELTYRVVLAAREALPDSGQLLLSLAGGRKTMSADLQAAAQYMGCDALLHVTDVGNLDPALREAGPGLFETALPAVLARQIRPLNLGANPRSELLDLDPAIHAPDFPLPESANGDVCRWHAGDADAPLFETLEARTRESRRLLGNFVSELVQQETYGNWRSLYRLPPARLQELRHTPIGPEHREWLQRLPKADLHRHIGGCLDLDQQRTIAEAIWAASTAPEQAAAREATSTLLRYPGAGGGPASASSRSPEGSSDWPWNWPEQLRAHCPPWQDLRHHRALCASALLLQCPDARLRRQLYGITEPRVGLKNTHAYGFQAYERPGELTGSAVLGHPAALPAYARALVDNARREGLAWVELRGSPHKYRPEDPEGFLRELRDALQAAGAITSDQTDAFRLPGTLGGQPRIGFVWILDRRQPPAAIGEVVNRATRVRGSLGAFLLGLDLAGDEAQNPPAALEQHFQPAFRACLPITIHAGEGEAADNIWEAAYRLHADRIGHGLTLADNRPLAQRFRDRGILLELCPSSNREVIGFHDPGITESHSQPPYPLGPLLEMGIPLTVCTDNPGISRTTLADEYLAAARMQAGAGHAGLTQWETLALIRQAFVHSFLPAQLRDPLEKLVEQEILGRVMEHERDQPL
ncbi:adenosine deaminase [Thioalkalivibrio sp. ALE21]|uniref:CRISPR-associated ring nuclease n=1 Tax=Thioalkalivibrio sp. ALE21 TaxID=1158175 RepID=UPI000DA10306|nr:CRISPR-associated ring nuclease [Thioalkalivibrio sp. ALE21]PYF99692.1 adenosine deaminase [Thioalkalivibrio sp. ALE21]